MFEWIQSNWKWLFDGIGAAFVVAVVGWIGSILFRRVSHSGQYQRGGKNSTNMQAGRDAKIGNISTKK